MNNEEKKSIFTLFSLYIPLFKANNSCHPSLQVESHRRGTTAIVVKTKEERWGSRAARHLRAPGARPRVRHTHKRATTRWHKGRQGKGQRRRTTEERTQGPSFVIPLIHQFSPGLPGENRCDLRKRKGELQLASCQRARWKAVTHLSGPNGIKPVTFLLWNMTCGATTSLNAVHARA